MTKAAGGECHGLLARLLRAVWSLREASYFGRWLIERDDEAGEALSPSSPMGLVYAALLTSLSVSNAC